MYSLPLSIDADEHRSGFKSTELSFSGFLEAVARASEMVSTDSIRVKTECLRAFLAQRVRVATDEVDLAEDMAGAGHSALLDGDEEGSASGHNMDLFSQGMRNVLEYLKLKAKTVL